MRWSARVVFEGKRAVGVEIASQARRPATSSAAARSSWPAEPSTRRSFCMLSGVGNSQELSTLTESTS